MKLVWKFAASFFVLSSLLEAGIAYVGAHREGDRLAHVALSDLELLAQTRVDGASRASRATAPDEGAIGALRVGGTEGVEVRRLSAPARSRGIEQRDGRTVAVVQIPLYRSGAFAETLEFLRPIPAESQLFRDALLEDGIFAVIAAVAHAALAAVLGALLVGGPLGRIIQQARRIGLGDFSQRLRSDGKDELGVIKRELNLMCDQLEGARRRLVEEGNAHLATLQELRHLDRLRTVGTIASNVAHELGTPLSVLLMRGQALESGSLSNEGVVDAGRIVVSQVEKMSRIVRSLLGYARVNAPAKTSIMLSELVARSITLVSPIAKRGGLEIVPRVVADPRVTGDATQLDQVLTNLLVNAVHVSPKGATIDVVVAGPAEVRPPKVGTSKKMVSVSILDRGPGVPANLKERIFEPFFTTKEPGAGTGLGLSVGAGIAEEHGGWISVGDRDEGGAAFTLYLPEAT